MAAQQQREQLLLQQPTPPTTPMMEGIGGGMVMESSSTNSSNTTPTAIDPSTGQPCVRLDEFYIPRNTWLSAYQKNNLIKNAEILLRFTFNDDEILNCTLKGKKDTQILDPRKKLAITRRQ
jgi:hypothetical protein